MPQLHLYLSKQKADELKRRAEARGLSVSAYLAELVGDQLSSGWPEGYFDTVIGQWKGEPLVRPPQDDYESREALE